MTDYYRERQVRFDEVIEDADNKALEKCVKFSEHRFVTIERDKVTMNRYARGHKTLRGACGYLSRAVEEGEQFVPETILDLDTGEIHEIDLFAFVAPKSAEAVAVMMPRGAAQAARDAIKVTLDASIVEAISMDEDAYKLAGKLIQQAIDRRGL